MPSESFNLPLSPGTLVTSLSPRVAISKWSPYFGSIDDIDMPRSRYVVTCTFEKDGGTIQFERRFRDFYKLRDDVVDLFPRADAWEFPKKQVRSCALVVLFPSFFAVVFAVFRSTLAGFLRADLRQDGRRCDRGAPQRSQFFKIFSSNFLCICSVVLTRK